MEVEIDLKEILRIMWRGKYWIIGITALLTLVAVFYVFFLVTPAYRYSALLDLTSYEVKDSEALALIEQNEVIAEAVKGLSEEPDELIQAVDVIFLSGIGSMLEIVAEYSDSDICKDAVKRTGIAVLETVSDYRLTQITLEKERNEKLLSHLDETIAEYLLSRDEQITALLEEDPIYKRLLEEKAACLVNLKLSDFKREGLADQPAIYADIWLNEQGEIPQPVTINKKLYIAVAVLFGLMISVLFIFTRHYLTTQVVSEKRIE